MNDMNNKNMYLKKENAHSIFESIKKTTETGDEFWSARDLAKVLEYAEYRNFQPVLAKAVEACENSANSPDDHIVDVHDMIEIGKGGKRSVKDMRLSRYACYLVIQNADPSKAIVALGQTYFAVQTRKQELSETSDYQALKSEDEKRLFLRNELKTHHEVGQKVRQTIQELGGTMPEELPVVGSVFRIERGEG